MKLILLGAGGMLGSDIVRFFEGKAAEVVVFSRVDCNVTRHAEVHRVLSRHRDVTAVINCTAYTAVDACETHREEAFLLNGDAVGVIATVCKSLQLPMVHFSTDYVFDGTQATPYVETDLPDPISVYGASKLAGEMALNVALAKHYIFRVQWLYGKNGTHFLAKILQAAKTRDNVTVINDQWGSPTWTWQVAEAVYTALTLRIPFGIYHFRAQGETTWYDLACWAIKKAHLSTKVLPISTADYVAQARGPVAGRPANGRLAIDKFLSATGLPVLSWQDALTTFWPELMS